MLKDYTTVVVGTDGSELAVPTVTRAAWIATKEDADLVIVCAYGGGSRRADPEGPLTATAPRLGTLATSRRYTGAQKNAAETGSA